tara:strand:+ start:45855 stop:46475 length:621 start_codon:yes stop_codon:yes gene_type:complete
MTSSAKRIPERRCIYTRETSSREMLIRFAVSPDGVVVPDLEEKLPGRGLWLTARGDIIRRACAENSFSKAARRNITVPADLPVRLAALLNRRCLDLIGLARRSGAAVAGFEKVRAALDAGDAALLIEAADGADDGREKLARRASGVETLSIWTADQLGVPFGRDRVVHVAILATGLADRLAREALRCEGMQIEGAGSGAGQELQES